MHRERQNKTAQDAFERVLDAKMGYLVGATDEFLRELDRRIEEWHESVRTAILAGEIRAAKAREEV